MENLSQSLASGSAELPDVVYHYTSMETLLAIVSSGVIRATSMMYLNDSTEREHFLRLIRDRISVYVEKYRIVDTSIFIGITENSYNRAPGFMTVPLAASFSTESDSLTQWRSYCHEGNGVSIGFRTECLANAFIKPRGQDSPSSWVNYVPSVSFRKIYYLKDSEQEFLDASISNAINSSRQASDVSDDEERESTFDESALFSYEIETEAAFVKNPSFAHEQEYRLLASPVYMDYGYLRFRASRSTLIPYIEISIPKPADLPPPAQKVFDFRSLSYIDNVVIGPTPNPRLSLDAVQSFFGSKDMQVQVKNSEVPFRDI